MPAQSMFYRDLTKTLLENLKNFHGTNNWDTARFGKRPFSKRTFLESIFFCLNRFLRRYGYCIAAADKLSFNFDSMLTSYGEGLYNTYSMLADKYSKRALVEILVYRLLGYRHMKLWTNTSEYWKVRAIAKSLPTIGPVIETEIDILRLSKTDLNPIGYPITIFTHPLAITHHFLLNHYAYEQSNPPVWLCKGDYVIDAGAAWGDTALRFAHEVGERGQIYAFEFEPNNIEILNKNLELNLKLALRINVVRKALWRDSSTKLNYVPSGPGTKVSEGTNGLKTNQVSCVSIDNFATSLHRVDFIKMDIEGAELAALQGAEQTIRKHRPKLAISLYHSLSDFVDIPAHLASLGLKYDYYIDHGSIHSEETVLFAAPRTRMD